MRRTLWMAAIAGLGMAAAGVAAWSQAAGGAPEFRGNVGPFAATAEPRATPSINFTDAADKPLTLADFKGKIVLLNFWATWCAPCVEEMPALDRLQAAKGGADFAVVAISVDRQGKPLVEPFLEKLAIKALPIYIDASSASMRAFNLRGLPTTILLDREGRERQMGFARGRLVHRPSPQGRIPRQGLLNSCLCAIHFRATINRIKSSRAQW